MKSSFVLIALLAAAFSIAFLGCEKDALTPVQDDMAIEQRAGNGPVQKVTGSGSMVLNGNWRTFAFNAIRKADGTVTGQWTRVNHTENTNETHSHGVVTCMTINGNQAWFAGYANSGLYSEPPNNWVVWRVEDNGQGSNAPPDLLSGQYVGLSQYVAEWNCQNMGMWVAWPIETGNIKIH